MNLEALLQEKFKYDSFRTGQKEIIIDLLAGHNVVAMLPTGGGKSITYQLPAYALDGAVVIVSPLLSLMEDQVNQLRMIGEKRVIAFNSFRTFEEKRAAMHRIHRYKFIFASPEMLQATQFILTLQRIQVALFVVDEAHCISQWGHDFRPDYQRLYRVVKKLGNPPVLALTATATQPMLEDIVSSLHLTDVKMHLFSIDRPNIALCVNKVESIEEKKKVLLDYIKKLQGPGIIYCSSRYWSEAIAHYLRQEGIAGVSHYHGGMEQEDRMLIQQQFIHDQLRIISCTSAFGMGINKPNIRYIVHFQYSSNIESYLQEIGRAGRDGQKSVAIILLSPMDHEGPMHMIADELPSNERIASFIMSIKQGQESLISVDHAEEVARNTFGFTEQHWRFVYFQLEKLGVITEEGLDKNKLGANVKEVIMTAATSLLKTKIDKLQDMQRWLEVEGCRREGLLQLFNYTLEAKPDPCCDRCGIDIANYCETDNATSMECMDWKLELQHLLYPNLWRKHE